MKMNAIRTIVAGFLLGMTVSPALAATEITFTGADAINPTNLASAANWSAAPGADTVGVIDLAQTPALQYVVNSNLELSGLKIKNNASKTVTLAGSSTLTLGADGFLSMGAKGGLTVRCPIATSADQTWEITPDTSGAKSGDFSFYTTFTGTHVITFRNHRYCNIYTSPNYDGTMRYYNYWKWSDADNQWVSYRATGKWANDVYIDRGRCEFLESADGDVHWKNIFPDGGGFHDTAGGTLSLVVRTGQKHDVVFDEGCSFTGGTGSDPYVQVFGHFRQDGGSIQTSKKGYLTLGARLNGNSTWSIASSALYTINGGSLKTSHMLVGYNAQGTNGNGTDIRFTQNGGTVGVGTIDSTNVGGGIYLAGGGNQSDSSSHSGNLRYAVAEYLLNDGTLTCGGDGNSVNLAFCSPIDDNGGITPAAVYTQNGGTASVNWLTFGSKTSTVGVNDGYGLLDLTGGTFALGASDEPLVKFKSTWNNDAATSNSVYSVRLHGGSLSLLDGSTWPLAAHFPKGGTTTLGENGETAAFEAPISGAGTIVKKGTGALVLTDGTRFRGALDVKAGTVTMRGAAGAIEEADDCFCWTADSLAATLADGAFVETWTDSNNGVVATTNGCKMLTKSKSFKPPKFRANAYNGHAAVDCSDYGVLCVPREDNPLYGQVNCSIVAVVRPKDNGGNKTPHYDRAFLAVYPAKELSEFCLSMTQSRFGVERNFWGNGTPEGQTAGVKTIRYEPGDMELDSVHAVALSFDDNGITYSIDGYHTNRYWRTTSKTVPIGWGNTNWRPTNYELSLQIGGVYLSDSTTRFIGDILEFRIYTNRVFSAEEQKTLTRSLVEKYDASPSHLATFDGANSQVKVGFRGGFTSWAAPTPVAAAASWDADEIKGEDGAAVTAWASTDGAKSATTTVSGKAAPKLAKNAVAGHAAVHFTSASKTALGLAKDDSPISGKTSFTAAVVWRKTVKTPSDVKLGQPMGFLSSSLLESSKQPYFVLGTVSEDAVCATYGNETKDLSVQIRKPCHLADGEPHFTIFSCDGSGKTYKLMTDGCFYEGTLANVSARGNFDVWFGCRCAGATSNNEFFEGDIAEIKLYDQALTKDEMRDLGEHWAEKYGTQMLVGYPYTAKNLRAIGLGATNVAVAAGARLSLPLSDTAPFTMTCGTLSGAGEFLGTYKFASGAVFDLTAETPSLFEELNLAGGATVKVTKATAGAHVRKLTATGNNVIDVTDGLDGSVRKTVVLTFDECAVDENASWTVRGASAGATVVVDTVKKQLVVKQQLGVLLIVR